MVDAAPVTPFPGAIARVPVGGSSIVVVHAGAIGGYITNPAAAADQGLSDAESLFIDPVGPAATSATDTTIELQPGQTYSIPPGSTLDIWVNAASDGHAFTAVVEQNPSNFPPVLVPSSFPPMGPAFTSIIPAYLYKQYDSDEDLQAFFYSYNQETQNVLDTLNDLNLPVYTQPQIQGALLDWVIVGLYGMKRPVLSTGLGNVVGPFNTWELNSLPFNTLRRLTPQGSFYVDDDFYKRIVTWHAYKGDGQVFSVRWLKRRVMRFLTGVDGTAPNIDSTYQVSVTFGANADATIRLIDGVRTVRGGAIFNGFALNTQPFNALLTTFTPLTSLPNAEIFKEAVDSGVLELPFQITWHVAI